MKYRGSFVPAWAKHWKRGQYSISYNGVEYVAHLLSAEMQADLPGFLGFSQGRFLFASDAIPKEFLPYILRHELREYITLEGVSGRCLESLHAELKEVPDRIKLRYIAYRLIFFRNLIAFYEGRSDQGLDALKREITASLRYLDDLAHEEVPQIG